MTLEEVYKQIDAEAEEAALVYPCNAGDDEPIPRPHVNGVRKAYFIKGATPYAEKWVEEKELRERYEKALKQPQMNNSIKQFGFIMAALFTIAGFLCIGSIFMKDFLFPLPAILVSTGMLFFMGATITLLLVTILHHVDKPNNNDTDNG